MLHTHSDLGAAMGELQIKLQDASDRLAASVVRAAELECGLAACKEELESARAAAAAAGGHQLGLEERAAELQKEVIAHSPPSMDAGEASPVCVLQADECRRGREALGTKLQSAILAQMGLVEQVQQLEAALGDRDAEIAALRAKLAAAEAAPASASPSPGAQGPPAPSGEAPGDKAGATATATGGWGAAAEKLDVLMELLGVAPEGDRVGRATRACERARELRTGAARAADRTRQLEAWRAEQVKELPSLAPPPIFPTRALVARHPLRASPRASRNWDSNPCSSFSV